MVNNTIQEFMFATQSMQEIYNERARAVASVDKALADRFIAISNLVAETRDYVRSRTLETEQ